MGVVRGENSLHFSTAIDNSGLRQGSLDAVGLIQGMGNKIAGLHPFAALAIGAATAFAAISTQAYAMAKNFESAMAEVKTIANVSESDFKNLEKSVFDIYKRMGTEPPDKLAKGLYEIIGAGFAAGDALRVLEISSKAATAGVTTTEVAADGLTTILNAFKLSTEEAEAVADIMFATVDRGKISFEELSSQIATVAPLAASSNISFEEIGAAISTLTKQGVPASEAMTQIRSAIISTNEVMGDGAFKTLSLQEGLQKMYEQAGGSQNKLKELAGRIEAVNAIIGIAGDNFKGASEDLEAMADSAGSVDRSFKTVSSTAENQWKIFGNRMRATTKAVGDAVLEMSNMVAGGLNGLFDDTIQDSEKLKQSFDEQRVEIFRLKTELGRLNETSEERSALVKKIIAAYPDYLKGINSETVSNTELLNILDKVNEAYKARYKFEKRQQELQKALESQGNIEMDIDDFNSKFDKQLIKIQKLADDNGIKLNIDYDADRDFKFVEDLRKQISDSSKGVNDNRGGTSSLDQAAILLGRMTFDGKKINDELNKQSKVVSEIISKNENLLKIDLKRKSGQEEAIRQIEAAKSIGSVSIFENTGIESIDKAFLSRKNILNQLSEISDSKDKKSLSSLLKSENEEIKKAAEDRIEFLNYKPTGGSGGGEASIKTFKDTLKLREDEYNAYNLALENKDLELAEKLKSIYKIKEDDYVSYLRKLYAATEENTKKTDILQALNGASLIPREIEALVSELKPADIVLDVKLDTTSINALERQLADLQVKLKSQIVTNHEEKQIRDNLNAKIEAKKKEIEIAYNGANEEKLLYEDLHRSISDLSINELNGYVDYWKKRLLKAKQGSDSYIEIENKIANASLKINEKLIDQSAKMMNEAANLFRSFGSEEIAEAIDDFNQASSALSSTLNVLSNDSSTNLEKATSVVGLFVTGYSTLKKLATELNKDKGLSTQISINQKVLEQVKIENQINAIYSRRNELLKTSSVLLESFYKDDYQTATQKQLESLETMNKTVEALRSGALIQGTGRTAGFFGIGAKDKSFDFNINDILKTINGSKDKPFSYNEATKGEAFYDAVNSVRDVLKALGKEVSDVSSFSTEEWLEFLSVIEATGRITDQSTKDLFVNSKEALEDYMQAQEDMRNVIISIAGVLENDLENALVSAFTAGEDAAASFKNSVSDILQDLFLRQIKDSMFTKYFEQLQKEMDESFKGDGDFDYSDDLKRFTDSINPQIEQAIAAMEAFNAELSSEGYTGFGGDDNISKKGLSGAISTITEDTANVLSGTLNSIRIDVQNGLITAQQSLTYLSQISQNTSYNHHLEDMNLRLKNIETLLR